VAVRSPLPVRCAYIDVVNDDRADHPEGDGTFERALETPDSGSPEPAGLGTWSRRPAGRHRAESKTILLAVAALAFLLGTFFSWVLRPSPNEQLTAALAEIEARDQTIAQQELENRWSIPKPSAQQVQAFFQKVGDRISCMFTCALRGEDAVRKTTD
jgi:hypothetical protein